MVNSLGHWLRVPFCTRYRITLRRLSGSWEIGFRIPFRGLAGFRVPQGLVVPENYLFYRSPLTTILNFNLSIIPSSWIFVLYTSMHGVTGSPLFGSSTRKVWLLIWFLISFWVPFSQGLFMSSDNFLTSAEFLGSGMKWGIYEPNSPKGKYCESYFTTVLNTWCKTLPTFPISFNAPFHSDCLWLIR